jgi:UDPglucose 6-dehydrogenase
MIDYKVGIIGVGFVGGAILKSFRQNKINVVAYDKYKEDIQLNTLQECLGAEILFLCLPTQYNTNINDYDLTSMNEIILLLNNNKYDGLIVIKSTITPLTTSSFKNQYPDLNICHNPEFLKAKNAYEDFHNQEHIVIGSSVPECSKIDKLYDFYQTYYPKAIISKCSSDESESIKLFINSFYASKIQLFNEYYLLCEKINIDFKIVKDIMLKNNRINPSDTSVPGTDGLLSYGGACFPKDTNALSMFMERHDSMNDVIKAVIKERNSIRPKLLE